MARRASRWRYHVLITESGGDGRWRTFINLWAVWAMDQRRTRIENVSLMGQCGRAVTESDKSYLFAGLALLLLGTATACGGTHSKTYLVLEVREHSVHPPGSKERRRAWRSATPEATTSRLAILPGTATPGEVGFGHVGTESSSVSLETILPMW